MNGVEHQKKLTLEKNLENGSMGFRSNQRKKHQSLQANYAGRHTNLENEVRLTRYSSLIDIKAFHGFKVRAHLENNRIPLRPTIEKTSSDEKRNICWQFFQNMVQEGIESAKRSIFQ